MTLLHRTGLAALGLGSPDEVLDSETQPTRTAVEVELQCDIIPDDLVQQYRPACSEPPTVSRFVHTASAGPGRVSLCCAGRARVGAFMVRCCALHAA